MLNLLVPASTCPAVATATITDGTVNTTDSNNYGSVVRYECDEGYQIDGVPRTYCQGTTWKHGISKPTCTSN